MNRTHLMLHHSLTKDSGTVSWDAIRKFHMETNGWRDIGYHWGVELVGESYVVQVGRPESHVAAACKEGMMNQKAIHICCVGNYDEVAPPERMLEILVRALVAPIMQRWPLITYDRIVGHSKYATYKSCPGKKFDIEVVKRMAEEWLT